jgi:hypothetical protein
MGIWDIDHIREECVMENSPELFDDFCLAVIIVSPIYLVLRFNLWGILAGSISVWVVGIIAGMALIPYRGDSVTDTMWILFGWLGGLMYASLIYGLKKLFLYIKN